ncbi:MAG TPA: hypothetical protein VGA29_04225 [Ignavibacteriaceae bacterium]
MKFKIILFLISISFYFLQTKTFAQPQLWEIYTISDQPFINVTVDKYESDSLYIKSAFQLIALHQDSIKYLIKRNESQFGLGFLIGAVLGGVLIGLTADENEGFFSELWRGTATFFGIILGGAIGGIMGLAAGTDTKYNLEKLDSETKRVLLNRLFAKK